MTQTKATKQVNKGQISETWQKTIENLLKELQQEKEAKNEIQRQLLEEYRALRKNYEEGMKNIQEQLIQANKLREEKNKLLQDVVNKESKRD